jgi:Ribbon-helix-helix protein, copG family
MRTTITLADDVAAAIKRLRRERSLGMSEAVNELIRSGLAVRRPRERFQQKTHDMGQNLVDLTNVGEAVETLDGPRAR